MARQSQQDKSTASRAAGLGWELAGAVAGFALLGYWIDRHFASAPWGLLICIALWAAAAIAIVYGPGR